MSKGAGRNVSTCRSPCGDATGDLDGSRGLEDGESGEDAGESGQTDSDCAADKGCWGSYKGPAHRTWRLEPLREKGRPREGRWFRPSRGSLQQKKGSLPFVTARINPPSGSGSGSQGRSWIRHHRSGSFWALLVIRLVENPLHDGGGGRIKATACPFLSDHLFSFHVTAGVSGLHRPMRRPSAGPRLGHPFFRSFSALPRRGHRRAKLRTRSKMSGPPKCFALTFPSLTQ